MARKLGVGVIGCGNISKTYFKHAPEFKGTEMRACADINMDAARARAKEFKLRAETVDDLLKAKDIDIVVNLTIPAVHYDVSRQAIDAGKHVYSEKPFVLSPSRTGSTSRSAPTRRACALARLPTLSSAARTSWRGT
jgi:predicted dehydrogenase